MRTIITASNVQFAPGENVASIVYQRDGVGYMAQVRKCGETGLLRCPQCGEPTVALESSYRGLRCATCNKRGRKHAE